MRNFLDIMKEHRYFKDDRWNKTDSTYVFETGSKIEFFSADQMPKVRGPRRQRLFLNEVINIPYETFDQLEIRTTNVIFMDWNPSNEFWFYDKVKDRKDVDFLILTYKDNEALDKRVVESMELRMANKSWWRVYGEGQLGEVETKIYRDWQIIEEIPHEARLERYGLDYGYSNDPTAIVAIYYYDGGYIFDEICYQKGLSNKQIADILNNCSPSLVIPDSAEPKSNDELKMYGLTVLPAVKGAGSVLHGIQWVQSQRCSVTRRSVHIIKDYRNYIWLTDKDGEMINEPDHQYSHCLAGETKVLMKNGREKMIKNIRKNDVVITKNGFEKVLKQANTFKNINIYEIELSNRHKLRGTGNHKIYTKRGKVAIDSLRYGDIMEVINNKKLLLWKKQSYSMAKDILGMVSIIMEKLDFIEQYGNIIREKFHKDTMSITKMEIQQTIKSLISSLLKLKNIYQNTIKETGRNKSLEKRLERIVIISDILQRNGMRQKKVKSGIASMEKKAGRIDNGLLKDVKFVVKNIEHIFPNEADFATTIVKRRRCGKEDVYNLTIDKEHNYYANGILVGNSMDAIRYGMSNIEPKIEIKNEPLTAEEPLQYPEIGM